MESSTKQSESFLLYLGIKFVSRDSTVSNQVAALQDSVEDQIAVKEGFSAGGYLLAHGRRAYNSAPQSGGVCPEVIAAESRRQRERRYCF